MRIRLLAAAIFSLLLAGGPSHAIPWNAAGAESLNVRIIGSYPVNSPVNNWDCCAYVEADTGHEYGILGADSVYVIDLADPTHPRRASTIAPYSPPPNKYVDVVVRGKYLYAAERSGPIRIIDLTDPYHPALRGQIPPNEFCACSCNHPCNNPQQAEIETLFIDDRGILYVTGINCGEGIHTYDIATDPIHPRWLCHIWTHPPGASGYAHDVYVRDNLLYVSCSRMTPTAQSYWEILNGNPLCPAAPGPCGDNRTPALIAAFRHTDPEIHAHSAWPLDDPRYLLTCDEKTEGHVRVWDVSNLTHPIQISSYKADGTCHTVHNAYPLGNDVYTAWYNHGIQIYDLTSPSNPVRVGYYIHPTRWKDLPGDHCCDPTEGDQSTCYGIWFIDPFFPSGIFIASEMNSGLLVGRFRREAVGIEGPEDAPPRLPGGGVLRVERIPGVRGMRIIWQKSPGTGSATADRTIGIYSAGGRLVAIISPEGEERPGRLSFFWDGSDGSGRPLPTGVYFARPPGETGANPTGKLLLLDE